MQIATGGKNITDLHFVEPLRKHIKSLNKNDQCIIPECKQRPVHSHIIPESVLALLGDERGKVLTWEYSDEEILIHQIRGTTWEQLFQQPKSIGIGKDATYSIFCSSHDNGIFIPLEKPGNHNETEQAALLAYRALCYKTWNPRLGEKLDFELANLAPEQLQEFKRIFSLPTILAARKKVEGMIQRKDYRELRWVKRILKMTPCIACTDAIIPYNGVEDANNITKGKVILTPEDYITFTFYPDRKLQASVCVITWFRGSERGDKFIDDLNPDKSSQDAVFNRVFHYALSMSLVYTSQKFWDFLSPEHKEAYVKLRMSRLSVGENPQN